MESKVKTKFKLTQLAVAARVSYNNIHRCFFHDNPQYLSIDERKKLVEAAEAELVEFKKFLGYE